MTISDLVQRLNSFMKGESFCFRVPSTAQVKLGKEIDNQTDVFDYFDVVRVGDDIVLVPSSKWERRK